MTAICIAYTFTCLGFCLGFGAAALLAGNTQRHRRDDSPTEDDVTLRPGAQ